MKKAIAWILATAMLGTALAGCASGNASTNQASTSAAATAAATTEAPTAAAATDEATAETVASPSAGTTDSSSADPQLAKKMEILTIWAEDNDNGVLINAAAKNYKDNVNPNFDWDYEMVSSDNLRQKIATLAASNDLPDMFAYESGTPLVDLIDAGKVLDVTQALDELGCADSLNPAAVSLLKGLSGTDDIYDLPLGLNVEGFWYNKALFQQAGVEVPATLDDFDAVLAKLNDAGIQPLVVAGADKWPATRLVNAIAVRTMGNDIMTKAADGTVKYTDPGLVAAANKIADWANKGYFGVGATTVDSSTAGSMLMTGKAAIYYNGSWFTSNLNDETANPAGPDGIGFFNIPIQDESISSSTSYSMNCGNVLCLDKAKYDEGTSWFLKYFVENMGNLAMDLQGSVKGYNYTSTNSDMTDYTKLVLSQIDAATEGFAWWEAKMPSEVSSVAQDNVQSLLNGDMTGEEYMQSIQEANDMADM
jgi:raffinose/stachyose/melibiose transport system substrate-binding protein